MKVPTVTKLPVAGEAGDLILIWKKVATVTIPEVYLCMRTGSAEDPSY
jgi:hypothetical protein